MNTEKNYSIGRKLIHKLEFGLVGTLLCFLVAETSDSWSEFINKLLEPAFNLTKLITVILLLLSSFWIVKFFNKRSKLKKPMAYNQETPDIFTNRN